jgi:predicted ATPase/two-component sensor histidine kinase/putative methionine-R-sulfoxide reductase with GAF domain
MLREASHHSILWSDEEFQLCRINPDDNSPSLLALTPHPSCQTDAGYDRLRQELEIAKDFDASWAVVPLRLVETHGCPSLLLSDPGGSVLQEQIGQPLELLPCLQLAVAISSALGCLHRHGLLHRDLRPANILVDVDHRVWLTGFAQAVKQRQPTPSGRVEARALPYAAPDPLTRSPAVGDIRSDLYSLGVILYQLSTGSFPFRAGDSSEWLYQHTAVQPVPPSALRVGLPPQLDAIVLKLLAKDPEDRYQSSGGVEHDLRMCLESIELHGYILPFEIGAKDVTRELRIPERLYGREDELAKLRNSFDRVKATGSSEIVLVTGTSGNGKSALATALRHHASAERALFGAGKFQSNSIDTPYSAFFEAFRGALLQILSAPEHDFAGWQTRIRDAVGVNGRLLSDAVIELRLIVGELPPVGPLSAQEGQNRFELLFQKFAAALTAPSRPLVLLLDDLQWADPASLALLTRLIKLDELKNTLVLVTYRPNEVDADHPARGLLDTIRTSELRLTDVVAGPLSPHAIASLLCDALRAQPAAVQELAHVLYNVTAGSPLLVREVLFSLTDKHLLEFNTVSSTWQWDTERIATSQRAAQIAELLSQKTERFSDATVQAICTLACLGHTAHHETLTLALGVPRSVLAEMMHQASDYGIIQASDTFYSFVHDQLHQAVYDLIPAAERPQLHLSIGLRMARAADVEQQTLRLFEIVGQINRGHALARPEERELCAELNLAAGAKAKASAAYRSAATYYALGLSLLGKSNPDADHAVRFELELGLAECEYTIGDFQSAEARLARLLARARDNIEFGRATCIAIDLNLAKWQIDRAAEVSIDYMRRIGVSWPAQVSDADVDAEFEQIWTQLNGTPIGRIVEYPAMTDPQHLITMQVLAALQPAAFERPDRNFWSLMIAYMLNLSLRWGICDATASALVVVPLASGDRVRYRMRNLQTAFQFALAGSQVVERRGLSRYRARVYACYGTTVMPWTQPLRDAIVMNRRASDASLEGGEPVFSLWSRSMTINGLIASGSPLIEVQREAELSLQAAAKFPFFYLADPFKVQLRLATVMRGLTSDLSSLFGPAEQEEFETYLAEETLAYGACSYWIRKLQVCFFAHDFACAVQAIDHVEAALYTIPLHVELVEYHFYAALALANLPASVSWQDENISRRVENHFEALTDLAQLQTGNFGDRIAVVSAEIARLQGQWLLAAQRYEEAIALARQGGFVQNEAIAEELASRFHRQRGQSAKADMHLRAAISCYGRWGADGKVRQLEHAYPYARQQSNANLPSNPRIFDSVDAATLLKVSEAITQQIEIADLVQTLLKLSLEHSGAERGLLLMSYAGHMRIEAEVLAVRGVFEVVTKPNPVTWMKLPESVMRYVVRTQETVIIPDAMQDPQFGSDEYVQCGRCRSLVCLPLIKQGSLIAILYLESKSSSYVFTPELSGILTLIARQAAISLDNARLYAELKRTKANLDQAQRLTLTGSFSMDLSTGRLALSNEFVRLYGIEDSVDNLADLLNEIHVDDRSRVRDFIGDLPLFDDAQELEHRIVTRQGEVKTFKMVAHAEQEELGVVRIIGTAMDVTASKAAHVRLQASVGEMQKMVSLIESTTDTVCYAQTLDEIEYINGSGRQMLGVRPGEDLANLRFIDFLASEERERFTRDILPVLERVGHWRGELILQNLQTGEHIPVHQTVFFINASGAVQRPAVAAISRDMTERRRMEISLQESLSEKEVLLKEVHHRVKNNLQLINSLFSLQAAKYDDSAVLDQFNESRNRVRAMALVHENLYRAGNFSRVAMSSHIRSLCAQLAAAYGLDMRKIGLVVEVDDCELGLDDAVPLGLIVNELVSNAMKHAFPDARRGTINVELKAVGASGCRLSVADDGVGVQVSTFQDPPSTLGLQLVHDLASQLRGSVDIDAEHGTRVRVQCSLKSLRVGGAPA